MAELGGVEGLTRAVRAGGACPSDGTTQRAGERGGAEMVPEPLAEQDRQRALVAGADERHDRTRAVGVDDVAETAADDVERLVPADRFEAALALGAHPAQRRGDPVGAVHAIEELVHLRAQFTCTVRVRPIPSELHGHAVAHGHLPAATVGTVVMAGAVDDPIGMDLAGIESGHVSEARCRGALPPGDFRPS